MWTLKNLTETNLRNPGVPLVCLCLLAFSLTGREAVAYPRMISYRYTHCATCHMSPQGGSVLTEYGRSVDQAQSFQGGEYKPEETLSLQAINAKGRINHEIRAWLKVNSTTGLGQSDLRLRYMNATKVTKRNRISLEVGVEAQKSSAHAAADASAGGDGGSHHHGSAASGAPAEGSWQEKLQGITLQKLAWSFRAYDGLEIAVGRDQIPGGVHSPSHSHHQFPTQVKAFLWTEDFQIVPYVFGPGGDESPEDFEFGAGVLGEIYLWDRWVVGANLSHGEKQDSRRFKVGAFSRLGFTHWGLLYQQELTSNRLKIIDDFHVETDDYLSPGLESFVQLYWSPREWVILSTFLESTNQLNSFSTGQRKLGADLEVRLNSNLALALVQTVDLSAGEWEGLNVVLSGGI